jgi:hypothetical protein
MENFQLIVEEILSLCKVVHCLIVSERNLGIPLCKVLSVIYICHPPQKTVISLKTFQVVEMVSY